MAVTGYILQRHFEAKARQRGRLLCAASIDISCDARHSEGDDYDCPIFAAAFDDSVEDTG